MIKLANSLLLLFCLLIPATPYSQKPSNRKVLLAAHRVGRIEVFDPITLQPLGSIKVLPQANGITSDSTGILFFSGGIGPEFEGCCALYAVDLRTREMTKLLDPVSGVAVSPDGQHVLAQRGNVGIEAFSVPSLQREAVIPRSIAPGLYTLRFSPDGRLLFGVSNFTTPSLDILDFDRRTLVHRFAAPQDVTVLGVWVNNDYYLYGYRNGTGQLWHVKADLSALAGPVTINFPDEAPECKFQTQQMLGAGGRLLLYEVFGMKGDRRDPCARQISGGFLSVDPQTGRILYRSASNFHFASLISSQDGKELYGIDVKDTTWTSVGLVRLNLVTGDVLASLNLAPDVWFINLTTLPSELVPSGIVEATTTAVSSR